MNVEIRVHRSKVVLGLMLGLGLAALTAPAALAQAVEPAAPGGQVRDGEVVVHLTVINALAESRGWIGNVKKLSVGRNYLLRGREVLEPGDKLEVDVVIPTSRAMVSMQDGMNWRDRTMLKNPAEGKAYCVLIHARPIRTFNRIGRLITSILSDIRNYEASPLRCERQAKQQYGWGRGR